MARAHQGGDLPLRPLLEIGLLKGTGKPRVVIILPSLRSSRKNTREKKPCPVARRSSLIWPRQPLGSSNGRASTLLVASSRLCRKYATLLLSCARPRSRESQERGRCRVRADAHAGGLVGSLCLELGVDHADTVENVLARGELPRLPESALCNGGLG